MLFTPLQAILAIEARIKGEWDNEQLKKLGALSTSILDDIKQIVANTTREPTMKVLFLREVFPDSILAIFPDVPLNKTLIPCYSQNGQHSSTSLDYAKELKPATAEQYHTLEKELEREYGYKLEVLNNTNYKL